MECPACFNKLTPLIAGSVEVDVCDGGCAGVWLDDREIKKFDEPHEIDGEKILTVKQSSTHKLKTTKPRDCPKCGGAGLMCRRMFDIHDKIEVDQCMQCSGIWLDMGELRSIRSQYNTEAERLSAANAWLDTHLGTAQDEFKALTKAEQEKVLRLQNTVRLKVLNGLFSPFKRR